MRSIAALPAMLASLAASIGGARVGPSERTLARRRELSAAWRWVTPRAPVLPKRGPRPAHTYRAARRNRRFGRAA